MINPANSDKLNILVFPGAKCEAIRDAARDPGPSLAPV